MSVLNEFRFLGICYGDARRVDKNKEEFYTKATIVVKAKADIANPHYVPVLFFGKLAEKAYVMCRNGNLISVTGEIVSNEKFNKVLGTTQIQLHFIVNDLILISRAYKKRLSSKEFSDLVEKFSPDEFEAPKGN